jgi:glycosyltransferase involved in cell wall biosynthesis
VGELPVDIWLVVVGSKGNVYSQASLGEIPPRVFFTGYVSDSQLASLYRGSLGFIYPSLGEGFGFPPLEAMASGVPVITSSVTALPEVCGPAALYVDPCDTADLARKIKLLATDESVRSRLSELGLTRAQGFTWERSASETLRVLRDVAFAAHEPKAVPAS